MDFLEFIRNQQLARQAKSESIQADKVFKENVKNLKKIQDEKGFIVMMNYWQSKIQSCESMLRNQNLDRESVYKINMEKNLMRQHLEFIANLLESDSE
jgi:hypothetical protein